MASTAVLGYNTIQDVVNQYTSLDAKAKYIEIARILDRVCPLVKVLPMEPSNQMMSHIGSRESYLPNPSTRRFNETIAPTASHTTPFTEGIAMFEDWSEVDAKLCNIQPDPGKWRMDKVKSKFEALTQKVEYALWYGTLSGNPAGIKGLAEKFKSLTTYPNNDSTWHYNCWDGGLASSSATTSIWLIEFGPQKVYGIYPANEPGGLYHQDKGLITKQLTVSSAAQYMDIYLDHFSWDIGIVVEDERCVQRYANIRADYTGSTYIFDEEILIAAKNQLPGKGEAPGTVIFANRDIKTIMDIRAVTRKSNTYFTQDAAGDVWGRGVTRFQGIPVMVAEKILSTETSIT